MKLVAAPELIVPTVEAELVPGAKVMRVGELGGGWVGGGVLPLLPQGITSL